MMEFSSWVQTLACADQEQRQKQCLDIRALPFQDRGHDATVQSLSSMVTLLLKV